MTNIHNPLNDQKLPTHLLKHGYLAIKITSCCLGIMASLGDNEKNWDNSQDLGELAVSIVAQSLYNWKVQGLPKF